MFVYECQALVYRAITELSPRTLDRDSVNDMVTSTLMTSHLQPYRNNRCRACKGTAIGYAVLYDGADGGRAGRPWGSLGISAGICVLAL